MTRPYRRLGIGVVAATAVAAPAVALAASPQAHSTTKTTKVAPASAQARLSSLTVSGDTVTLKGRLALTPNTAAERGRARVAVKLDGANGYERYVLAPTASDTFSKTWTTKLHGSGTVYLRAELSGHNAGSEVTRAVALPEAPAPTKTPPTKTPTTTTPAPAAPAANPITTTTPTANEIPLVGTFEVGAGSTFQMFTPGKLTSIDAPLPLTAGSDGGLETFGYQSTPVPAFAANGDALASRIITPLPFDGINFTVSTNATDLQTGAADPVPSIDVSPTGTLSGQVTAWNAQWNNQNFNQGTPKPDGTTPGQTTKISGTYNWSTGAYTITWQSLIVSGPFNNFVGVWHLQGTFDPAKF